MNWFNNWSDFFKFTSDGKSPLFSTDQCDTLLIGENFLHLDPLP